MKNYIVFDKITGEIQLSGVCSDSDFEVQIEMGLSIIEGQGTNANNYVLNNTIQYYNTQQQQDKANRPYYPCAWSNKTFVWIDQRTDQDKYNEADTSNRFQRDNLLYKSDWTQIPNNPLTSEKQQEWAVYRQQLRDITKQSGYPFDVIWPIAPLP